jgi:uncharacterized OB-fold protein
MSKTRSYLLIFVFIILAEFLSYLFPFASLNAKERSDSTLDKSVPFSKISKLNIPFIPNQGQTDKRAKFYANTFGGMVFVTERGEIIYSLPRVEKKAKAFEGWVLKEELLGGKVRAIKGAEKATARVSYFIGNDSSLWRSGVPTYGLVNLGEVYRGIKVKLRAYGRSVEKLFYVRAGANPGRIRLRLSGGESFRVDEEGGLEVGTALGEVKFSKPVAYQEVNGGRVEVPIKYDLHNPEPSTPNSQLTYGFKLGDYDRKRELVIDPLLQSTYLGGSGDDMGEIDHVDSSGNVYVVGSTSSTDFPGTSGGAQPSYGGGTGDVFIAKFNSKLTRILQSTYLGGSGDEWGWIDHVDSSGNVYLSGSTNSTNFPGTSGGAQPSFGGGTGDVFIAKLNSTLTSIQSTYLGGNGYDSGWIDYVDSSGNIYVVGSTDSTDFPGTSGGAQPSYGGGTGDVFIAKLNSTLTSIQSTYLGGNGDDSGWIDHVDSSGNIYMVGSTDSTDFPGTTDGAQPSFGGGTGDVFIAKLNSTLSSIQSTYLGGSGDDMGDIYYVDSSGNIYVAGWTDSTDFPGTTDGAQPSYGGGAHDVFIAKLNSTLSSIQSTYLGGSGDDMGEIDHVDSSGNIYVAGWTDSTDVPWTADGAQPSFGGGTGDVVIAKLNSTLSSIQSTYLGGNGYDSGWIDHVDSSGNIYVVGSTDSTDFPGTTDGAQPSFGGGTSDVFIAKLNSTLTSIQSTYLGGNGDDMGEIDHVDSSENIYVAGWTDSTDFPGTPGGAQPSYGGGAHDVFIAKLNSTLTSIQSTYLGGSGDEWGWIDHVDSSGNIYVVGWTDSTDFPWTPGGAQPSYGGGTGDVFIAKLNSNLTEPPGEATLISPSGAVTTTTPTYTWNAVSKATEYNLKVNDSTGNKILQWYTSSEAGCASGIGTCSVTPITSLAGGSGTWWIQTKNAAGTGPWSSGLSFTVEAVSTPSIPSGPTGAETNTSYTYIIGGSTSNVDHSIEYFLDWGDGTNSDWLPVGTMSASHSWALAGTYLVKAQARCATHTSMVSSWSKSLSVTVETISNPTMPSGETSGTVGTSYVYLTGDSSSELGHSIQYLFDWGDGTNSGWLPVGKTSASKSWVLPGVYSVKAKARCAIHNSIISSWSTALDVSMQKVTVLHPNGREVIPSGNTYTIEWTAPTQAVKFKLLYSIDNGATWILITTDATGASYDWTVPVPTSNKNSCYVKVVAYNASNVKVGEDKSDEPFAIGVMKLFSPNGGEVLESGEIHQIQWEINGTKYPVATVKLYYSVDAGATWSLITSLDGASTSYDWTVPVPTSNKNSCYVKVVAYNASNVKVGEDKSDEPFAIGVVKLFSPNGGEVLESGEIHQIQWEINGTKYPVATVKLYYSIDAGATWSLITSLDGASTSYDWTVPVPTSNKNSCYVKVVAYSASNVKVGGDKSDEPFVIGVVKLLSPNGGEVLESGEIHQIQWEINGTKYPVATVKLYYSVDAGATWSLIITLDGTFRGYDWIPLVQITKTKCKAKVVIYDTKGVAAANDMSDSCFAIQP